MIDKNEKRHELRVSFGRIKREGKNGSSTSGLSGDVEAQRIFKEEGEMHDLIRWASGGIYR